MSRNRYLWKSVILFCIVFSCKKEERKNSFSPQVNDNVELLKLYNNDQADRAIDSIDWNIVSKNDHNRRKKVLELLDSNKLLTGLDYYRAALIFQHGIDSISSTLAVKMMKKSIELDSTVDKWLLAAAIDRDLMRKNRPQIFGTQFVKKSADGPWERYLIDTTKISDNERIIYGVKTLSQQRAKELLMNKKRLNELLSKGKTIDEIMVLIKKENNEDSDYNVSQSGINRFGGNLMARGLNNEALRIFALNIELNPDSYEAYDSYSKCLLKLGDTLNSTIAYRKSFELNSQNRNPEKIQLRKRYKNSSPKIYGVQVNVLNIDSALDFYSKNIGFKIISQDEENAELHNNGIRLRLEKVPYRRENKFSNESRTTLSFHTNDLDSLMNIFGKKGVSSVQGKIENGVGFSSKYKDPFGNEINFMEQSKFPVPWFKEPKIYNVGLTIHELESAKKFYCDVLGFKVRTTKFLPALPLGHKDGTFAFMLHEKNVRPSKYDINETQLMIVFSVPNMSLFIYHLELWGIKFEAINNDKRDIDYLYLTDPFGNKCKIIQRD